MTETTTAKLLYTVKDVSKILHTNQTYVYKLINAGLLPALKLGSIKICHEDLIKLLNDCKNMDLTDPKNIKPLRSQSTERI